MTAVSLLLASSVFAMQITSDPVENQATAANSTNPLRLTGYNYSNCIDSDFYCTIEVAVDKNAQNPFKTSGYFRIYDEADGARLVGIVAYYKGQLFSDRLKISMQPGQTRQLRAYLVDEYSIDSRVIYTPKPLTINAFATNSVSGDGSGSVTAGKETYSKLEKVLQKFKEKGYTLSAAALSYYLYKTDLPSDFNSLVREKVLATQLFWDKLYEQLFPDVYSICSYNSGFNPKNKGIDFYHGGDDDLMYLIGQGTLQWDHYNNQYAIYPSGSNGQLYLNVTEGLKLIDTYNFDYGDAAFRSLFDDFDNWSWAFTLGSPMYGYFSAGEIRNIELQGMVRPFAINVPLIYNNRYPYGSDCY